MATNLIGSYPSMSTPPHNQVYNLTHDGDAKRSFVSRAYLSFSYGGKDIEDFGLIATFGDDGKTGNLYGNFEDITSSYNMLDGQFYWGTHFTNNTLNFTLATDGMTQNQLDEFKYWFRPGQTNKELILSEHSNRATLARVAQSPTYTLIPFEYQEKMGNYSVKTALYKGTIQLNFIMDNPFWYLKKNFISIEDGITDDNLKVMHEDGIPFQSKVLPNCFYGGNTLFDGNTQWGAIASNNSIWNPYNQINSAILDEIRVLSNTTFLTVNPQYSNNNKLLNFIALQDSNKIKMRLQMIIPNDWLSSYFIAYGYKFAYIDPSTGQITWTDSWVYDDPSDTTVTSLEKKYYSLSTQVRNNILYQNGDAWFVRPSHYGGSLQNIIGVQLCCVFKDQNNNEKTWISKEVLFNDDLSDFIFPGKDPLLIYAGNAPTLPILNFKLKPLLINSEGDDAYYIYAPYNTYATGNGTLKYNSIYFKIDNDVKAVFKFTIPEIYDSYNQVLYFVNTSYDLSWPEFIDLLKNSIHCAPVRAHAIQVSEYFQSQGVATTKLQFKQYMRAFLTGNKNNLTIPQSPVFTFNSATGEAFGQFNYYIFSDNQFTKEDASSVTYKENVGSMVKSNYLVLEEKNQFSNGEHQNWYTISTDYPGELTNFLVLYNTMYY